jgi:hypothetical protein
VHSGRGYIPEKLLAQVAERPDLSRRKSARALGEQGRSREHDREDEYDYAGEQCKITNNFCHAFLRKPTLTTVDYVGARS